jgi:hypothetical protein
MSGDSNRSLRSSTRIMVAIAILGLVTIPAPQVLTKVAMN